MKDISRILNGGLRNKGPLIGLDGYKPLALKHRKHLSHASATGVEHFGQFYLLQPHPGAQPPLCNGKPNPVGNLFSGKRFHVGPRQSSTGQLKQTSSARSSRNAISKVDKHVDNIARLGAVAKKSCIMDFDFTRLEPADRYRLLTNFVGPRPIALVATRAPEGHHNGAPMSFFNVFSHDPAIIALGIQPRADGREKDTVANIRRTGEFTINMVDMALSRTMLICGLGVESDIDEFALAGETVAPGASISAGWLPASPCAMECRVDRLIEYPRRLLVLGEVVHMHVRRDCLDEEGRYVDPEIYQPIARLHADNYIVSDRQFVLKAPPLAEVLAAKKS